MKLFTASRAVGLAGLIVVLAGICARAQDVTVTDPAWFDPEKPGADTLPTFKKRPSPAYPRDLKKDQPGYVLVPRQVDEKGGAQPVEPWASHPHFSGHPLWDDGAKFLPATKGGKATEAVVWYAVLFHPKSASATGVDGEPRLLTVAPVVVSKARMEDVPGVKNGRLTVWAKVALDAAGAVQGVVLDNPAHEVFRSAIEKTLATGWRFAPARRDGRRVAAETAVAFAVMPAPDRKPPTKPFDVPPKSLSQAKPVYPFALRLTGQAGEVTVDFIVDKEGNVTEAAVVTSNHPAFEEPAMEAIHKWKFKPGMKDGKPVYVQMRIPIVFNIEGSDANGAVEIARTSADKQAKIPEALRYDVPPKAKGILYPAYPYDLLLARTSGKVEVTFLVNDRGRVSDVRVLKADRPEFGEALSAAVAAFQFVPASKDGKPVLGLLRMEHKFQADGWSGRPSSEDLLMVSLVKKSPEKIVSPKALDAPLKPISRRAPVFPATAKSAEGSATIEVLVDKDGHARLPRIVSASEPALGYAAAQAAGEWRFEEPKAGGKSVVTRVRLPFMFGPPKAKEAEKTAE